MAIEKINLLSWNIHSTKYGITKLMEQILGELVNDHSIDIVILQEAFGNIILESLNSGVNEYVEVICPTKVTEQGIKIFLKKNEYEVCNIEKHERNKLFLINLKKINKEESFNLAAVHLHSKVGNTDRQQMWKNLKIFQLIKNYEISITKNNRTILIGDFNCNPFDMNLLDPYLINVKNSKDYINNLINFPKKKNENQDIWYNPMWNFLGDFDFRKDKNRLIGTYYIHSDNEIPSWNLIDGIILRKDLMESFSYEESFIISKSRKINFLKPFTLKNNESIIKDELSDHLPIKFTLKTL